MRHVKAIISVVLSSSLSLGVYAAAAEPAGTGESASWQHHQEVIDYYGVTASYTCTGIEDKLKELLKYLGARPDFKVVPLCARQESAMHQVFARLDFYSLAPSAEGAAGATTGHWIPIDISPTDPLFRDRGECELFQNLKNVITKDFAVRDIQYKTTCTPNDTTLQDYKVTGEILAPRDLQRAGTR